MIEILGVKNDRKLTSENDRQYFWMYDFDRQPLFGHV